MKTAGCFSSLLAWDSACVGCNCGSVANGDAARARIRIALTKNRIFNRVLLLSLVVPSLSYGYIDPGSGSVFLQFLLGGGAGLYALYSLFKQRIRRFLRLDREEPQD